MMSFDHGTSNKPEKRAARPGMQSATIVGQVAPATFLVQSGDSSSTYCCELASLSELVLRKGDRVLINSDQHGQHFIIGIVGHGLQASAGESQSNILAGESGASVEIADKAGRESLQVRDKEQRLIFEYLPDEGEGHISIEAGRISLNAEKSIDLTAGTDLRLFSGHGTRVDALGSLDLTSNSETASRIGLGRHGLQLSGETLLCAADRGIFKINRSQLQGESMSARLESAKLIVSRMETVVKTLFEKATDVFRQVGGLHQLTAKRTRTVCEDSHAVIAKRVRIDGNYSVKLQGDKIHLG